MMDIVIFIQPPTHESAIVCNVQPAKHSDVLALLDYFSLRFHVLVLPFLHVVSLCLDVYVTST